MISFYLDSGGGGGSFLFIFRPRVGREVLPSTIVMAVRRWGPFLSKRQNRRFQIRVFKKRPVIGRFDTTPCKKSSFRPSWQKQTKKNGVFQHHTKEERKVCLKFSERCSFLMSISMFISDEHLSDAHLKKLSELFQHHTNEERNVCLKSSERCSFLMSTSPMFWHIFFLPMFFPCRIIVNEHLSDVDIFEYPNIFWYHGLGRCTQTA